MAKSLKKNEFYQLHEKKKSDIFTFIISRLFASYLLPIGQWANQVVLRVASWSYRSMRPFTHLNSS